MVWGSLGGWMSMMRVLVGIDRRNNRYVFFFPWRITPNVKPAVQMSDEYRRANHVVLGTFSSLPQFLPQ